MTITNLTLEPIAALNVTIPKEYRSLNLALVDVGAGTADIAITHKGSVVGYAMVPWQVMKLPKNRRNISWISILPKN